MSTFLKNLRLDPAGTLDAWQDTRTPWAVIAAAMILMVLAAHYVFQGWLHMQPCEQCVYIRFWNLVTALGAVIALINPKALAAKLAGYILGIAGVAGAAKCALKLIGIHAALASDDPDALFGMAGCSMEPHFPLDLPLQEWAPSWFMPTGECGIELPFVPDDAVLSAVQQWFIELYQASGGWYLIPQLNFMTMAQCCLLACVVAALFFAAMAAGWICGLAHNSRN